MPFRLPDNRWWNRDRAGTLAVCGLLLLAVGLVFGQAVRFDFVNYDDGGYVAENPMVSRGLGLGQVQWAFTHSHNSNWHPLTWLSLMLDRSLYGPGAGGYHLTNVLLHALAAVLLFLAVRAMTGRFWAAACVAALFAVHPLRAESVAWVTERKDVLSGVFFMATLLAYVSYARGGKKVTGTFCAEHPEGRSGKRRLSPFSPRYLCVVVLFGLGLMCKPMLVTLPLVLLLLDYWPLERIKITDLPPSSSAAAGRGVLPAALGRFSVLGRLVMEKVPLLLLSGASCALTVWAANKEDKLLGAGNLPYAARIANVPVSCVAYLRQFFYPVGLAPMYPWEHADLRAWKVLGAVLVLAAVTVGAFRWRRARPYFVVGWLWYLGMLVPVSGLLQVGEQTRADRFTYLPQIGLCMVLIFGILDICRNWRWRRWWYAVGAACALAALSAWAWRQTTFWSDSKALWGRDLACTSVNSIALLGYAAAERGGSDEAVALYRRVLERHTAYPRVDRLCHGQAHASLGRFLADRGRIDEAMSHFRSALELGPVNADAHNSFGFLLAGRGRLDEAIWHYQAALGLNPDYAEAHNNLGVALVAVGRVDEAVGHFRRALQIKPDLADAHYNLGVELAGRGRLGEAMAQFRATLKIKPGNSRAHNNLGVALALGGRTDEAMEHFRKALEITPDYPEAHRNLGDLQARRGRIDKAIEHYQKALDLAEQQRKAALVEELKTRLQHYGADVPQP